MTREAFEKLVAEGFERLPERVRGEIKNVALLVEDQPSEEVREREKLGNEETLLGYYQGVPQTARGVESPLFPDTITLYQLPIEDEARASGLDVRDVIAETIWHEYAHHFGMDEGEVQSREQKRDER